MASFEPIAVGQLYTCTISARKPRPIPASGVILASYAVRGPMGGRTHMRTRWLTLSTAATLLALATTPAAAVLTQIDFNSVVEFVDDPSNLSGVSVGDPIFQSVRFD